MSMCLARGRGFETYTARMKQRLSALSVETDSVRNAIGGFQRTSDSLGAVISRLEAQQREYDLRQTRFGEVLIAMCDSLMACADAATPSLAGASRAAADFLRSERAAGGIDNIEGINRLVQIINDLEMRLMEIEISQGVSPLPDIPGTVYRLRLGSVFEAVVDEKGERCAVWSPVGTEAWAFIDDPRTAGQILKAIKVREGKTRPELVELPFAAREGEGGGHE